MMAAASGPVGSIGAARRYEVLHRTEYGYQDSVSSSYGWAHLTPRPAPGQVLTSSRVDVAPAAALLVLERDYFGNHATYFEVHSSHTALVVTSSSTVEVDRPAVDLTTLDSLTWEQARDAVRAGTVDVPAVEAVEFRLASPRLDPAAVADYAASVLRPGRPLGETLRALTGGIRGGFRYRTGSTTVGTAVEEVLATREGVCQDFAHLAVACLRWAGLPARYVSGYLETSPPPGRPKLRGADASHAWASVLVPELGWVDIDPTNDTVVDSSYVVTAWGRDYSDVAPLRGVIFTESESSTLRVAVDVTRLP
jgi:transglutaminase-like putative cysteine protease